MAAASVKPLPCDTATERELGRQTMTTGTPILPVAIGGAYRAWDKVVRFRRPRLTVNIGQVMPPVQPPVEKSRRGAALDAATQAIMQRIYELLPAEDRARYDDLARRRRYLNARHTIETLLAARVIPVANENDTVAVEEIKVGENDNLSALIATLVDADLLIILSDVAGLHTSDPRRHRDAELIELVEQPRGRVMTLATDSAGPVGTGGMASKMTAARKASLAGIPTIIADGTRPHVLQAIVDPRVCVGTLVLAQGDRLARRKHWIAYTLKPGGALVVDQGAYDAIVQRGRSLLPKGVHAVRGSFGIGDCVRCLAPNGVEFARGLANYSAAELDKIKGLHSNRIEAVLGAMIWC